jgi:hypothetical protein
VNVTRRPYVPAAIVLLAVLIAPAVAQAFHPVTVDAQWSLLRISPSGRTLVIGTPGGGCFRPPQVTVEHEDAVAVQLQVRMTYLVPDGEHEACTADFRIERASVTLSAPLAGRRLVDQWRLSLFTIPSAPAPRMVGVRAGDALRALANQDIPTRLVGPVDGTVVRQRAAPGRGRGVTGTITLIAR